MYKIAESKGALPLGNTRDDLRGQVTHSANLVSAVSRTAALLLLHVSSRSRLGLRDIPKEYRFFL